MKSPRARVLRILRTLWCDLPARDNAFANNFIQAIATTEPAMGYRPDLLRAALQRVSAMLLDALPPDRKDRAAATRIANVLVMAFDGYVIGRHLNRRGDCDDRTLNLFADLLTAPQTSKGKTPRRG